MVKHIILWNLKDEFNNDEVKKGIKEGIESRSFGDKNTDRKT